MINRKEFISILFFLIICPRSFSDSFLSILQDLAKQTACIGSYSATQAGEGWYDDPHDYYTPQMLAVRFKKMSGDRTRTQTFYGVCFDYAQAAWDDIRTYQKSYNSAGMKDSQWYIAAVDDNPNYITLYDPVSQEKSDRKMNGVYLKRNSSYSIQAHGNATHHAWLWIQHQNGTWYWIDPTWTDNTGYVYYGIISNGKEIQYTPDTKYCVSSSPVFQAPQKPKMQAVPAVKPNPVPQQKITPSPTPVPLPETTPNPTPYPDRRSPLFSKDAGKSRRHTGNYTGLIELGYHRPMDNFLEFNNSLNLSISFGDGNYSDIVGHLQLDYFGDAEKKDLLIGYNPGFQFTNWFALYAGGGIGMDLSAKKFAWKVNGGARFIIDRVSIRGDVTWLGDNKFLIGIYAGYLFDVGFVF